jgi:hypothetical protein
MAKRSGLERLTRLYGRIENLHAQHVKFAASAVGEAEQALRAHASGDREQESKGRKALAQGSRVESLAGLHTAGAEAERRSLLSSLASERRRTLEAAVEAHRICRMEFAQMEEMIERIKREGEAVAARSAQNVSDDRFLSRRHWTRRREGAPH